MIKNGHVFVCDLCDAEDEFSLSVTVPTGWVRLPKNKVVCLACVRMINVCRATPRTKRDRGLS